MDETRDLEELIEKARGGDNGAFRVIFDMHIDRLFGYALAHTKDRGAALDITQDTFVAFWVSLPSFTYKGKESFLGFIFLILKRKLAAHYKKSALEREKLDFDYETAHEDEHEDHRHLLSFIDRLGAKYQEVLKLRYWGSLSFAEVAETLGIREPAARVLHHRAIKKLSVLIDGKNI